MAETGRDGDSRQSGIQGQGQKWETVHSPGRRRDGKEDSEMCYEIQKYGPTTDGTRSRDRNGRNSGKWTANRDGASQQDRRDTEEQGRTGPGSAEGS